MFSAIKNYGIAILSVLSAILLALLYRSKAKYETTARKSMQKVMETEKRATETMVKGLDKEAKARAEIKAHLASVRDKFNK